MIDLSFLTEAEQEAILKVLHRDAELKKAEEERVRQLQDAVDDDNELKNKSGQWFYDAKSKRHRDTIHGADLVRASIRKRKKPSTIAELSEKQMDKKKSWVNSVKNVFIPPELYGVMEEPEEGLEDLQQTKEQINHSAKRVSFLSADNDKENLMNGAASPAKIRKNPFNAELDGIDTDFGKVQLPENGTDPPNTDKIPSYVKFGVKLPYPESKDTTQVSQSATNTKSQVPIPKPRTLKLKTNEQPPNGSSTSIKRDNSINGMGMRKGILKRCSSSSSTDSETVRITQGIDVNKIALPGSPILEIRRHRSTDQDDESSENGQEQQKQVRFAANVLQRSPSPNPETFSGREFGEFRILEPMSSQNDLHNPPVDDHGSSEDSVKNPSSSLDLETIRDFYEDRLQKDQSFSSNTAPDLLEDILMEREKPSKTESPSEDPKLMKRVASQNDDSEPEPLYAVVKRIPKQDLPEDFDMEDIHMKPRVFGQEWKKPNVVSSGKPLEFGKSYGGGGKISYGTSYLNPQPQSNKVFSTERPAYTESYESGDKSWSETEDEPSYIDSVHSVIVHQRNVDLNTNRTENQPYVNNKKEFGSLTSKEETKEPKFQSITFDANPDDLRFPDNQNKRNLEYFPREPKTQSKYKPVSINNVDGIGENVPANLSSQNLARNDIVSDTRESLNLIFLNQLREKNDLPQSANFKVMSLKDRINDSTNEQISNPSQFQSLRSYWNVEEKNKDTEVSPNSILSGVLNRSKPVNSDPPQINFAEVTVDPEVPTNTVLNDFISRKKPLRPALQSGSSAVVSPKVTEVSNTVFTDSARTRPIKSDSQQIYPTEITKDPSKNIEVLSKFLPRFQNKPAPITSEIPQREITDPLLLPDTYDSISEEDQTSQKVASWLAQSPNHYEEEQMYPSEEPAYPREEVVENIKKSVAPQKSNVEEFSSALEKLREEAFLTPNTEMEHLGTTEESKGFPTQDAEMHHHDLETLSEEDQASQKVSSWLERTPPNYDEEMYPSEEHLYPQEEIVENVQKTLAPQRSDKDEFSSALAKLQEEASFSTDEMVDHTADINTFPKEEVGVNNMKTSETALPVKNLGKESYGNKARSGDIRFFEKVKQISKSSENEAANTFIPRNTIDSDRVERHHPVKEAVQDFQPMNSGGTKINSNYAQEEVVVQKTLAPVNNANDAFKNALERLVKEHETLDTVDNSEYENSIEEEQSHVYEAMGVHKEEIIERTTLPTKQDLQEFTAALNRLEIEASETSHIPETSSSDHFEEPRSNLISSRESPVLEDTYHRRENIPYCSNEDQSNFSIQFSRATSTSEEEIETLNKDLYMTLKMLPDIKYSEAYPVHEETSIAESINTDELQRRLMQIHEDEDLNEHLKEEDVKPPNWDSEEPNDLVKDKVKVSEIPYKETLVSKKVYSDIESKPSLQDESEPEPHDLTYPIARRPQDLYLASRSKSPLKNAGYGETGSYSRRPGNLSYKQPEIEPPEVSKPSSVETKQGKPAMVDDPSDNASSKPDKYTIEILKAKTESITKVLDWFSRSAETGEEEEIPPKKPEELTNPTGESKDKPIKNIDDSAQESLVLNAVSDNGQQKANGQPQTSSKSSVDSSKNSSAKSEHVLNVEIPKAVDVKVPPVASKVKLDPQNSNEEVAEQLVVGELKSGLDKMHPTVDHETGGEDVVITPENTEKEHLDIFPKKIEDSKKENEPVLMSGEPGTSLVKVGVGETKVDSPVFLGQESGKKAATISRMPLILERSASLQQPIQTEQKKVREAILLGTGDTNVRALVKKLSKDSMSPVSPTEIPEKGNRVIPRKNSSDIFAFDSDDNSNGSLVAFKKVIVDDEDRTPNIAQLKSFWEKEKSEPETVRDNTRRNLPRRNIQSLIKHAASTPTLNEDLDTGKLSSITGPGSMKHILHYSFEKAQNNAPSYLRSVSLSEGINDNDDKFYKPLSFKSLRSFWNEGNTTTPPAGKSTTISTKQSSIKFDVVKEQDPAVAKDDRSLLVRSEENLSKREPNKVIISSKFISIEKCNEEKTKTSNNLDERTKEKSQGNATSSQSKAVDFSAKIQEKEPNKGIYSVQSSIVTNLPIVVTQQSNISLGHYDLPEADALPVQERETTETSLVTQNPEDELFQTEMPNGTKVSEVSMSVLPKPSYEESTPDNVTSAEEPNVILSECTGDCVPSLHEPKVSYEESTEDNVPRLKEQSQSSNKREVIEEVIEKSVAPKPKPRAFQAGLQNLFNEFVEDSPASGKPINNILPNPVYKPENVESEMQLDPGNVSIPEGYNLDNLITENNKDLYSVSDESLEVKVPAAKTPLIEPNISLNQDLSVKKKLDMLDPLAISGSELVHQSIIPQNMEITEFTLRLKKLQNEKAKDDSAQQELQALSSQSGPQESETLEKEEQDNQNEETRHPEVNETVEKTVIKRTNEFSTSLEKLAKESEAVVTPIPIAEMEDAYPQKASTSKYIFSEPEDEITEEISKTCVVPRVFNDFDAGLQKLYNESLDGTTPSFNVKAEKNEHMDENELEEESVKSRILEVASNKNESMIINRSPLLNTSQESASHNPMNISVSTKKMGALANKVSNGSPQQEMSNTSGSFAREKSEDVYKTVLPFKAEFEEINQNREYLIPVELSKTPLSVVVEVSKTAEETMVSQKPNDNLSITLENLQTPVEKIGNKENCHKHDAQNGSKDIHSNDADTTLDPRVALDTPDHDVEKFVEKTVLPKSESLVKELKTLQKQEKVNEEDEYVESLMPSNPTTPNQLETEQNQRAKTESSLSEMLPTELKISTSEDSFSKKSDFVTSADTEKETENVSQKSNSKLNVALANPARNPQDYISLPEKVNNQQTAGENVMPKKQRRKEIEERIEKPTILPRTRLNYFNEKLQKLYKESVASEPIVLETTDLNEDLNEDQEEKPYEEAENGNQIHFSAITYSPHIKNIEGITDPQATINVNKIPHSGQNIFDDVPHEVEVIEKTVASSMTSNSFMKSLQKLEREAMEEEQGIGGSKTASIQLQLNPSQSVGAQYSHSEIPQPEAKALTIESSLPQEKNILVSEMAEAFPYDEKKSSSYEDQEEPTFGMDTTFESTKQSTPLKDRNSSLRRSTLELYLQTPYQREISKSMDFENAGYVTSQGKSQSLEDPVLKALKRTAAKTVPKDVQDIPPTDPNKEKLDIPNRDLGDLEVPSENLLVESQFSNPEKLKRLSQSVPVLLQDETDGRETDSASESSFQIGRHKKSPSSLTNLSGSSGMASLSSVSGSVMSVYSGDFGNIDIKGNIQFAVDYVEQLQEFHVFVSQCKDLAVADLKKQRSDPYVKSYLLPDKAKMGKRKTVVKKKSQNPSYNEVLRYKISKEALLTQTLNLSVWHNDALGRNSFLGEVDLGLATWDWNNKQMNWYPLQPRTPAAGIGLENRGDMKLALKYVPEALPGTNVPGTGEVHIQLKECKQLPMLRGNKINSFIKCTILPDTSRKSRQKTRAVDKTPNPIFNHTMVYDGFKTEDLKEACVELTVWDRNRLTNHFLGGLRIGLGTGKSYGTAVDWMDSSIEESTMWERMMNTPNTWIEGVLPLRMLRMAKLAK